MYETDSAATNEQQRRYYPEPELAPVLSVFDWVVINVLMMIPLVNIIVLIIWALDANGNPNRMNYAKAYLIIIAIQIVLAVAFLGAFLGLIFGLARNFGMQF